MNKYFTFFFCLFSLISNSQKQPDCSNSGINSIYLLTASNVIYRIDNVNTTPSLPVRIDSIPASADGLTISNNLNDGSYSPTFYSVIQGNYSYWNGSSWINSGHQSLITNDGNLGGGIKYIYNHRGTAGSIYRYDGTGTDVRIVLFTSTLSVWDVATDSLDNFYVLVADSSRMYKFDSTGAAIDTFQVTGGLLPPTLVQPGIALLGNTFYVARGVPTSALLRGTVTGHTISFVLIANINVGSQIQDIAACPSWSNLTNVNELTDGYSLSLFPNPTVDGLRIQRAIRSNMQTVQILDYTGQVLYDNSHYLGETIDTRQLPTGIYLLKYSDTKSITVKKFAVQH